MAEADEIMARYRISGVPICKGEKLVGIITNRDLRFVEDLNKPVSDVMTAQKSDCSTSGNNVGTSSKYTDET